MKKFTLLALPLLFAACKPKDQAGTTAKTDSVKYAYTINWVIDTNTTNTQSLLSALKAFEVGDTAGLHKYFADTVAFNYDGGKFKGPVKEFLAMSKAEKDSTKALTIKMIDWEPVISKDKTEQWVTVWYKQTMTYPNGKTDSTDVVNDALFKNAKIVRLDEYLRHLK